MTVPALGLRAWRGYRLSAAQQLRPDHHVVSCGLRRPKLAIDV